MKAAFLRFGITLGGTLLALAPPGPAAAEDRAVPGASAQNQDAEDLEFDKSEPDFTVITLPTNLRLPRHKLGFGLTHRFARDLGRGDFGDLLSDFFGFDGGAQIGLGLRFGLLRGTQLAIYRTSDRTIQFFVQSELVSARRHAVGVSLQASIEGRDNFSENHAPALSLVVSRKFGDRGAAYLVPRWVGNTDGIAREVFPNLVADDSTFLLGVGLRLRLYGSTYIVGEYLPRLAGYKGDIGFGDSKSLLTFAIEKQVGGHAFQINFSNDLGTTPRQTALGGPNPANWYIGFNLSRKFF